MNELELKTSLQIYLSSNVTYAGNPVAWNGATLPRAFVNVFKAVKRPNYGSIQAPNDPITISIELSIEIHNNVLDTLDTQLLQMKDQIEDFMRRLKTTGFPATNKGRNIDFQSWKKDISIEGYNDNIEDYKGKLIMIYEYYTPGIR